MKDEDFNYGKQVKRDNSVISALLSDKIEGHETEYRKLHKNMAQTLLKGAREETIDKLDTFLHELLIELQTEFDNI